MRIDMSEFMEKHSVARLIGAPPGYVGYEEGGYLTEVCSAGGLTRYCFWTKWRRRTRTSLTFCYKSLEDGRLTDGQGRTVDFKNTVIVMTSNLGSDRIQDLAEQGDYAAMKAAAMTVVGQHFRPEFINRVDETVVFHPLAQAQIRSIASIQLASLRARLADRELALSLDDSVLDYLAEAGFDPVYGARPLKRAIVQLVENPLAQAILSGEFAPGDTIEVTLASGTLAFAKAATPKAA